MKAMILAAGKGTRMQPITYTIPKPMIPLIRKPVMECIIEHLQHHGVKELVVNTSYLPAAIEDYFRDGEQYGVHMAYSFEGYKQGEELISEALGSAGGMKRIQDFSDFFDETFIVLCGDALIDLDISKALEFHRSKGALATIILKEVPESEVSKYGVVETDEEGRILQFQEKPKQEEAVSTSINTGIYLFEPEIFEHIPDGKEYDIGGELFPELVKAGVPFYGVSMPFQWLDIGSLSDYWEATRTLLKGEVNGFRIPGKEIKAGIYAGVNLSVNWDKVDISGPVYIGSSTAIGDGVTIKGPALIGANCMIEAGALIDQCLIHDYTRVSSVARLEQKILYGDKCIEPNGQSLDIDSTGINWLVDDVRKRTELDEWQQLIYKTLRSQDMEKQAVA